MQSLHLQRREVERGNLGKGGLREECGARCDSREPRKEQAFQVMVGLRAWGASGPGDRIRRPRETMGTARHKQPAADGPDGRTVEADGPNPGRL
jgi:hypothetical protein